jgi:WD40 repeat protein
MVRATLVGAAWWTDPVGRRHVRIVGRRLEQFNEYHQNRFGPLGQPRPALALVHPDACCLRHVPGKPPELLAVCGCGTIGRPEALGWMGDCCGPCHDHREEKSEPLHGREFRWTYREHPGPVLAVVFASTGRTVVSADSLGKIHFWDPQTMEVREVRDHDIGMMEDTVGFACNGQIAAMAAYYDGLSWYDADTGRQIGVLHGDSFGYHCLAVSPDGRQAAGSDHGRTNIWELSQPRARSPQQRLGHSANCLTYHPDGGTLLLGNNTRRLTLHELSTGHDEHVHPPMLLGGAQAVRFAPDGRSLAVAQGHDRAFAFSAHSGIPPRGGVWWTPLPVGQGKDLSLGHSAPVYAVAFTPDSSVLVSAGLDRVIRFWSLPGGELLGGLEWHVGTVRGLAFSPDGALLTSAGSDGLVHLWPWRQLLDAP